MKEPWSPRILSIPPHMHLWTLLTLPIIAESVGHARPFNTARDYMKNRPVAEYLVAIATGQTDAILTEWFDAPDEQTRLFLQQWLASRAQAVLGS